MQNYVCARCLLQRSSRTKKSSAFTQNLPKQRNASSQTEIQLKNNQIAAIGRLYHLKQRFQSKAGELPKHKDGSNDEPAFDTLVESIKASISPDHQLDFQLLEQAYGGKKFAEMESELDIIGQHRRPSAKTVSNDATIKILEKLKITSPVKGVRAPSVSPSGKKTASAKTKLGEKEAAVPKSPRALRRAGKNVVIKMVQSTVTEQRSQKILEAKQAQVVARAAAAWKAAQPVIKVVQSRRSKPVVKPIDNGTFTPVIVAAVAPSDAQSIDSGFIAQRPLETENTPKVPGLSFDLSRALFNPGVYQLRDPRSRVYNFDPYLENIMPVQEFNFEALNAYITSSEDQHLRNVALKYKKKYIGSSSSMSGAMSHFHFLLSAWRPLNTSHLSQQIDGLKSFTIITRAPSSIYLRWRDGVYAIDADKEHDTPNILMMQGKSMEKLLTMEKDEFEKYRRPAPGEEAPIIPNEPEAYHYTGMENFLLRSQLDAYDPRLPGTGMFDLKTRAVAGIRMDMTNYEHGMGYQIKDRYGAWESYEREYFDMIRASFLKYSLQVRMGRMDGIFVAYHNIARIFGFQYVPITELDACLHGQTDRVLGDREFRVTIKLMNEIFDQATKIFPQQSIRFMIETRDASKTEPHGVMQIFAEAMEEEEIERIQKSGKDKVAEYEKKLSEPSQASTSMSLEESLQPIERSPSTLESTAADTAFLEEILGGDNIDKVVKEAPPEAKKNPVASWTLRIYNQVNDRLVVRPEDLRPDDRWVVKYKLERRGDDEARKLYTACKVRRSTALIYDDGNKRNNFFIERIRRLSASGKTWREQQDALDAEKEPVLLYNAEAKGLQSGTIPDQTPNVTAQTTSD